MDDRGEKPAYDETAALKELERFREEIDRQRARRKAAGEEFDQFIRSFKSAADIFPAESQPPAGRATPAAPPLAPRKAPLTVPDLAAPPPVSPSSGPSISGRPAPQASDASTAVEAVAARSTAARAPSQVNPVPDKVAKRRPLILGGALVVTILAVVVIWSLRTGGPQAPLTEPAPVRPDAAPVQTPAAPPVAATPPVQETVLTTIRPAWVRVIADGERIVERELPANARVPIPAAKTIVVRTGDAGAVRLMIAGQDQGPLGGNGQVVTRTFGGSAPDSR
jgi:hypothetical protein